MTQSCVYDSKLDIILEKETGPMEDDRPREWLILFLNN
jgi:hypothetical protein